MGAIIKGLRGAGNTVLMVERSPALLAISDRVLELGPAGGAGGGRIVADGKPGAFAGGERTAAEGGRTRAGCGRDS